MTSFYVPNPISCSQIKQYINLNLLTIISIFFISLPAFATKNKQHVFLGVFSDADASSTLKKKAQSLEILLSKKYKAKNVLNVIDLQVKDAKKISIPELKKLISLAKNAFVRGHLEQALSLSQQAEKLFNTHFLQSTEKLIWQGYAEILLVKILALERLDKISQTKNTMRQLIAQMPSFVPDPGLVPPKISQIYTKQKEYLLQQKVGALNIESSQKDADIYLNGLFIGKTPMEIQNILPGTHHILIVKNELKSQKDVVLKHDSQKISFELQQTEKNYPHLQKQLLKKLSKKMSSKQYIEQAKKLKTPLIAFYLAEDQKSLSLTMAKVLQDDRIAYRNIRLPKNLKDITAQLNLIIKFSIDNDQSLVFDDPDLKQLFFKHTLKPVMSDKAPNKIHSSEKNSAIETTQWIVIAGSTIAVTAVLVTTAAVLYFIYLNPKNPNGTDFFIDTSRM